MDKLESGGYSNDLDFENLLIHMNQFKSVGEFIWTVSDEQTIELAAYGLIVFDRLHNADKNMSHIDLFDLFTELQECFSFSGREFILEGVALQRKEGHSLAGKKGADRKHAGTRALTEWALAKALISSGDDKKIAKTLRGQLPDHLKKASVDPERLIYDALRAERKRMAGLT
jgi:hypothetical protein